MRLKIFAASSALTLAVVGCAGSSAPDGSDSTETEQVAPAITTTQALAVVDFENGAQLRFYEAVPGLIVTSRHERLGEASIAPALDDETPVQLYERLAGKKAPEALQRAQDRSGRLTFTETDEQSVDEEQEVPLPPPGVRSAPVREKNLSNEPWFYQNFCMSSWPHDSRYDIQEWRLFATAGDAQQNDIVTSNAAVMNFLGSGMSATYKVRPWATWSPGITVQLPQNTYTTWSAHSVDFRPSGIDFDAKVHVSNPFGAIFDLCMYGQKGSSR